jgi:hypothetical protein
MKADWRQKVWSANDKADSPCTVRDPFGGRSGLIVRLNWLSLRFYPDIYGEDR